MRQHHSTVPATDPSGLATAMAEHEPLVHWVVHRQWLGGLPYDEAVQAGRIGLWRACLGFDPTRGHRFSSYAVPIIARAVWRAVAEAHSVMRPGTRTVRLTIEPDLEAARDARIASELLLALVAGLPERLRTVMVAHYGLGDGDSQTYRQIARARGVTRQRIQQLELEARLWLADPAVSVRLRRHLEQNTVADYQTYLARRRAWQRARRSRR
jgi:RNA polymerase sigma factor (sigma-70 family)